MGFQRVTARRADDLRLHQDLDACSDRLEATSILGPCVRFLRFLGDADTSQAPLLRYERTETPRGSRATTKMVRSRLIPLRPRTQLRTGTPYSGRQLVWIIVEDSPHIDPEVAALMAPSGLPYIYTSFGPTTCVRSCSLSCLRI